MIKTGYIDGYMAKTAAIEDTLIEAAKTTGQAAAAITPYLFAVPLVAGAGAGLAHAKLTSPTKMDAETAQKALEKAELEEFLAELKRRRRQHEIEQAEAAQLKEKPVARSLHI